MDLLKESFDRMDIDLHVHQHGENVALHDLIPVSSVIRGFSFFTNAGFPDKGGGRIYRAPGELPGRMPEGSCS